MKGDKNMEKIIPPETYDFIEYQLHNRAEIQRTIDDWRLSVLHPEDNDMIPGSGYVSDPTANQAVKLANPPKHIRECEKWLDLINRTHEYCRQNQNKIFEVWYDKPKQSNLKAMLDADIRGINTLKSMRDKAVYFLLTRALESGLCRLKNNEVINAAY
jgi:hypothetical protein